jgi:hypothetical protein
VDWLRFWDYTTADWAGLQFAVLVAAALVALRQVREARRLRVERSRPFVIIDLVAWQTIAEFEITNIGTTIARDVRFEFDPPLHSSRDNESSVPLAKTNLFKHGIRSLAPGKEVVALFDQLPQRIEQGLPDDYEVTVSYADRFGAKHSETMTVGYSFLRDVGRVTRRGPAEDIHKEIREIARELRKWTYFGRGLRVMTNADVKEHRRELDEQYELQRQAEAEAEAAKVEPSQDAIERLGPTGFETEGEPSAATESPDDGGSTPRG